MTLEKTYSIVVGSGISGLTAALLLAKQGHHVVIVEKMPVPGGLLNRFKRKNILFDTGFHFTGGFEHIFPELLQKLGIYEDIVPKKLKVSIFLGETKRHFNLPNTNCNDLINYWISKFPNFKEEIRQYYTAVAECVENTPVIDLNNARDFYPLKILTAYDSFTLDSFLDHLKITDNELRTVLTAMAVCHGTPPSEAPFPYHARCTFNLDDQIVAIEKGGSAFINAMIRELKQCNASIMTSTTIQHLQFDENCKCTAAAMSNGITLPVNKIVFTTAPEAFRHLLPPELLSANIRRKINRLIPTCSFFSVYGILDSNISSHDNFTIFFKENNVNSSLLPNRKNYGVGMVTNKDNDNEQTTFTAFKTCFSDDIYKITGLKPDELYNNAETYRHFKQEMTAAVINDVYTVFPEYRGHLKILDSASPLTCRRYCPPVGSAYGTRQLIAQSRLPATLGQSNCHVLGHHTQFPGILGSMLSAYTLFPI